MINYPPDFPAAACAVIEHALADAEDEFIAASAGAGPVRSGSLSGDVTYVGMWDRSDRAAVSFVVDVFGTIVATSCAAARADPWPANQLRATTTNLLTQLTELTYRQKHSKGVGGFGPITLDDFTTVVHRELRALAVWSELQNTIRELSKRDTAITSAARLAATTPAAVRAHPTHKAADRNACTSIDDQQRPTLGRKLDAHRRECGWSIAQLAAKLEMEESTVKKHLNDHARPRPQNLRKYVDVFNEKLAPTTPLKVSDLRD